MIYLNLRTGELELFSDRTQRKDYSLINWMSDRSLEVASTKIKMIASIPHWVIWVGIMPLDVIRVPKKIRESEEFIVLLTLNKLKGQ